MKDISVVIVNYNVKDFLSKCLNSIAVQSGIEFEIIVVDNASQDNTGDMMDSEFPYVKFIQNGENMGFGRANNQALRLCDSRYLYFLNPDTIVRPNAFRSIIKFMDSHPEIGLAGTRLINPDGSSQPSVENRYPSQRYARKEQAAFKRMKGDIAWVSGASMIARQEVIESVKGFDEDFFLYAEETDLCLRIRKAGWAIGYIPEAVIVHWKGKSEQDTVQAEVWKKKFRGELTFYKKHYPEKVVRKIRNASRIKAYWRIFTLKMMMPFYKNNKEQLKKLEKYKTVLDIF